MDSSSVPIRVVVAGALGRMGSEVVRAITNSKDCELVGAIDLDKSKEGFDIGVALGLEALDVFVTSDFEGSLCSVSQSSSKESLLKPVLIDFTHPSAAYQHTRTSIAYGVHPVIGTTGISSDQLNELIDFSVKAEVGGAVIPNFSVGMILLQKAASEAARFYKNAELTEMHHNRKADAPSGTCIKTAELMEENRGVFNLSEIEEEESLQGSRGGYRESGLRLHSIRLPGLVAYQEVMFGSKGETYKLSHNTIDRSAYMPGVLLTVRKVINLNRLIYGLEKII